MESRENIRQYRRRLDKTLASHDLANEETLKTLVKNQMLCSSQCEVEECTDTVIEMDYLSSQHLSLKWTTGVGPRIGCAREYPPKLQYHAMEQVNLPPPLKIGLPSPMVMHSSTARG